ncbi:MAG: ABC transporter permease, partial [Sciscionella sp.]
LIAAATGVLPVLRDLRVSTVASARAPVGRVRSPRWQRYGLDLWLLLGFAVVFYFTSGSGYHLVLAPEGIPSISVSYWAFAGPVLLWLGAGLLTWRLVDLLMHRGRPVVTSALRPVAGALAPTAAATLSRQRRLLARTVVLVVLAIAFAGSTAIFNATYQQQARADAQLTNGADVTATLGAGTSSSMSTRRALAGLPGVASLTSMQHRYAYVGPDLQDLYGVHPKVIAKAVHLQDAYFQGGTAAQLMGKLAAQPDAILVSAETVRDYQLHPGDLLKLRLPQRHTQHQVTVPFHYVGVVKEFPTAPKDSFFVANADYVSRATDGATAATYLITTGSGASPSAVAGRVRSRLGPTAKVTDIQSTRRVVGSSLTAVDLGGLTRVELGFALLLAAGATGLLLVLGFTERRRTFALLRALGARPRELGALVRAEVGVVVVLGAVFGAIVAWALAEVLVAVLTGVFDPPPDQLAVPWPYLAALGLVGLVAAVAAGARVVVAARRPALEVLRDL